MKRYNLAKLKKSIKIYSSILIACLLIFFPTIICTFVFELYCLVICWGAAAILILVLYPYEIVLLDRKEKEEYYQMIEEFIESSKEEKEDLNIALLYHMHINDKFNKLKENGYNYYNYINNHEGTYEIEVIKDDKTYKFIFEEYEVYCFFSDNPDDYTKIDIRFNSEDEVYTFINEIINNG